MVAGQGVAEQGLPNASPLRFGAARAAGLYGLAALVEHRQAEGVAGDAAQFAYVARPVGPSAGHGGTVEFRRGAVEAQRGLLEEVFEEQQDVLAAAAQRRQFQATTLSR